MNNMISETGKLDQSGNLHHLSPKEQSLLAEIRKRKDELLEEIQQLKKDIAEVQNELDILDQADDGAKVNPKARQWSTGRNRFNRKAKEGIQYLIDCGLLNNTPEDIALFLYKGEGLNKIEIGQYLGGHDELALEVLKQFVELHQFEGMLLVEALRQFLWNFHLPGEAQSIDRMMEAFAQHYCQQNPEVFTSTDTCYVLSFSVIMLNTSLHNPSVKDKPTLEKFIIMNRGINNGGDLPRELLQNLYENIKNEPFKVPDKDGDDITRIFFNPDISGWLTKEGGSHKNWKRRYFILKDNCLYYFKNEGDKEPRGIIPLENLRVRKVNDSTRRKFLFEIFTGDSSGLIKACKTNSEGKVVEGHHDVYRICASTEEERENWIKCINAMIIFDPFYDMLQTRKRRAIQSTISAP